jgi:hypothetical protein
VNDTLTAELRFSMIPEWILDSGISDKAIRLYCVLARYADNETHRAFPSRETLAKRMGCHAKSVDRAASELIKIGAVTKKQRHNSSLVYTLMMSRGVDKDVQGVATPVSRGVDTDVHLTRTTELEPKERKLLNKGFDQFWAIYPKKDDKPLAKRSFEKALKRANLDVIVAGAERYRDDPNREQLFTKNPSTWLNADAWENGPLPSRVVRKPRKLTNAEEGALLVERLRAEEAAKQQQPKQLDYDMGITLKGIDDE